MITAPVSLIGLLSRHRTAANLLMALMIVVGIAAATRLNTQFFPTFGIDVVTVGIAWPGASAGDVEANIVEALEPELRTIDEVDTVVGMSRESAANIIIEFEPGADMQAALSAVESAVAQVTTLPEDSEEPIIQRINFYDTVSRVVVSGPFPELALKTFAKQIREDLLARGVDKVTFSGARDEEIWVEITPETLLAYDLTLTDVAEKIRETSQDVPSGTTGSGRERQIRSLGLLRSAGEIADVALRSQTGGAKLRLGDIATVTDAFDDTQPTTLYNDQPAIDLHIQRASGADALEYADIVNRYLDEIRPTLPATLTVEQHDIAAESIRDRINLLLRNGVGGLALVLAVLFLFLNARIAFWIAVGIPTALLATLAIMLLTGQSINMISLFALIMMIGIVVDDAIVVAEHAAVQRARGLSAADAAEAGARRMTAPVFSATLTTLAAFLPLMLVSGIIGKIIVAIPWVVAAVLLASLVESFLILPGHMRGALSHDMSRESAFRKRFNAGFERLRDGFFKRMVVTAIRWRYSVLALTVASLIATMGLVIGGRVQFVFFPSPESDIAFANFSFAPGTPRARSEDMLAELRRALLAAERKLAGDEKVVRLTFGTVGASMGDDTFSQVPGDHLGALKVELMPSEHRSVRTPAIIDAWRDEVRPLPGLEVLAMRERQGGPPGRDLDIRLSGPDAAQLKEAALALRDRLGRYEGVSDIADDLPWGKQELILKVSAEGRALGFTTESVARQVRAAFEGVIAKRFARADEEVTVRVRFPERKTSDAGLRALLLRSPEGREVPLSQVVAVEEDRGFAVIRREDGVREVAVTAEVDEAIANPTELVGILGRDEIPALTATYGVDARFAGKAEEQAETLGDMRTGTLIGLIAIYIILAWVFASYARPIVVMAIIPFAVVGAVLGHWLTGYDLTILSLFGLLGLSGIVVNDSIILVTTIDERLRNGQSPAAAIVDGTADRLRPVILTSLTTIGGLLPLMTETSLQAQFLKPMALTLVFGLMATTVLVLALIPALIAIQNDIGTLKRRWSGTPKGGQKQDEHRKQFETTE